MLHWIPILILAILALVILLIVLYWINPDKATKMLARFALTFRSVEESRTHTHHREEDDEEHEHKRRVSITDFAKTMMPTKAPVVRKRRSGDKHEHS